MTSPDLDAQLAELGYTPDWLEFGVLSLDTLNQQTDDFRSGRDSNTEHYRYPTFRNYLSSHRSLTDDQVRNYVSLAEHDPDPVMASAALIDLVEMADLTDPQFTELCALLDVRDKSTAKIAKRARLLRQMQGHDLTDALFSEGLDSGDRTVQLHMLTIANPEQLKRLAESGASRKIRNQALQRHSARKH